MRFAEDSDSETTDSSSSSQSSSSRGLIPISHWRSLGHDAQYAKAMAQLQLDLKRSFLSRFGTDDIDIKPRGYDDEESIKIILMYDDLLLDYWFQFASSLFCNYGRTRKKSLTVTNIQLSKAVLDELELSIKRSPYLTRLGLVRNIFGRSGILFAAEVLGGSSGMTRMEISENHITDLSSAVKLSQAITNSNLRELVLKDCEIGCNSKILSAVMTACKDVVVVCLNKNNIGLEGATIISNILATNPSMKSLYLQDNNLDDDSSILLARALKANNNLKHLDLNGNNLISRTGREALLQSIFDQTSLNNMAGCNHSCRIWEDDDLFRRIVVNNSDCAIQNKKNKISLAINKKGTFFDINRGSTLNLSYFDDVPVNLLPNILYLIQIDFDRRRKCAQYWRFPTASLVQENCRTLTKIYEILHDWKMPLLFINQ